MIRATVVLANYLTLAFSIAPFTKWIKSWAGDGHFVMLLIGLWYIVLYLLPVWIGVEEYKRGRSEE